MRNNLLPKYTSSWRFVAGLLAVLLLASAVRLYGLNWDRGTHLHPDERYLTMVVSTVRFPGEADHETRPGQGPGCQGVTGCLSLYWDTARSPLNPATYDQFATYVYGTLPLFITRATARWVDGACATPPAPLPSLFRHVILGEVGACNPTHYTGYGGIHLVGRSLSAFSDLMTLLGLVLLAKALYGKRTALLAGFLYAFAVLPIQHAHFFVVDSFATVFVVWTLLFAVQAMVQGRRWTLILAGLLTGLAVASKISVWPLAGIVGLAGLVRWEAPKASWAEPPPTLMSGPTAAGAIKPRSPRGLSCTFQNIAFLILAGLAAAVAFRASQPYAFAGPGFFNVRIDAAWLDTMQGIRDLMRGIQDVPYGHQWTARTPIVFPLRNMVIWGLGLPLGLAAWLGWAWVGWDLLRGRLHHLLIWLWATGFFLYQAMQWVKSMRYLLPVYPVFILFAAWAMVKLIRLGNCVKQPRSTAAPAVVPSVLSRLVRGVPVGVTLFVGLGTLLWSLAFLAIYQAPLTRIEASDWIYTHVPTAVVLQTSEGGADGEHTINIPWAPNLELSTAEPTVSTTYIAQDPMVITGVILPKVHAGISDDSGMGDTQTLNVAVGGQIASEQVLVRPLNPISLSFSFDEPIAVRAGEILPLSITLKQGTALTLKSAMIANEHWDDPLPLRMEGKDGFWNWYQGLSTSSSGQMNNYDEDTLQKRFNLLAWLSEADYIVLSSNRLYASIPRLSQRYPLTTAYYRHLMDGSLGFELAAEFVSYPRLGACQFPDQENPFTLIPAAHTNAEPCSLVLPPAEEAFSVYDHPTVLIFKKTSAYDAATAERLLPRALVDEARWMTPREATAAPPSDPDALLLSNRMRAAQEAGGTWSRIFNSQALQNRRPQFAIVLWSLLVTLLGWLAFPLVYHLFPALRCRGYGLSRMIGVLIWAYLAWLLASLHILPYTRLVLWLVLALMAIISAWIAHRRWSNLTAFISARWRTILLIDGIFLTLFLLWVGIRWLNPDLWHPVMGGEKPMDFAYFNATIKSTWFPPYDPWFAGGQLNYYYFGFVIVGSLTKALGIVPSVAYNLAIPTLFALTGVGGYVLASNLAGGDEQRQRRAGLVGVATVVLLGNLGEVQLIVNGLIDVGGVTFESMIPNYPEAISALVGLWKVVVEGVSLPFRPEWWYWDPTRIIPVEPGEIGPINEFPAFTFLYGDLHAHAMALPLTQIALAIALQWALSRAIVGRAIADPGRPLTHQGAGDTIATPWTQALKFGSAALESVSAAMKLGSAALPQPAGSLLLAGLVGGALRATNTWDYPTYMVLMSVGFLIGRVRVPYRNTHVPYRTQGDLSNSNRTMVGTAWPKYLAAGLITPVLLVGCAELLFRPFSTTYEAAYAAFELWSGSRTPLKIYLLMYGPFLFPIVVGAILGLWRVIVISEPRYRTLLERARALLERAHTLDRDGAGCASKDVASAEDVASTDGMGERSETLVSSKAERLLWLGIILLVAAILIVLLIGYFEAPRWSLTAPRWSPSAPRWSLSAPLAWLAVPLGLAAALLLIAPGTPLQPGDVYRQQLIWFWVGSALALSLLVEVAVLKGDIGRMNTVFKFHLQVWMLLALSGAVFIERILYPMGPSDGQAQRPWRHHVTQATAGRGSTAARSSTATMTAILLLGAATYPMFAIPAKIHDRWVPSAPHTLDGMAYMRSAIQYEQNTEIRTEADYRVIRWLQENVVGSPTIIEAVGEREYLWGNRISIYTGLPTVVGWRWHQVQQRMVMPAGTVEGRQQDVRLFYSTTDAAIAHAILEKYQVSYVILGPYERAYMLPEGLPKFNEMVALGWLEVIYQDDASTIYKVIG